MEQLTWGFIGTIVGALVGASASIVTTVLNTKNTHSLQKKLDLAKKEERHKEFQCNNLMLLQDELSSNMRLFFRVHLSDIAYYRQNPAPNKRPLIPEDLDVSIRESNQKLSILTERVEDDTLRADIDNCRNLLTKVSLATSESESSYAISEATQILSKLMENLGVHIRNLYKV
ncbi:hypothetical protein GCM10009092_20100 [Bowmanella denitrificans]|uniref:Uncharacterized protein n=1 Tax=Bowmanella denitrificans TaxID=366582 RepID=A0ABN0X5P8_9ALTE